jgi:hypothetical protein
MTNGWDELVASALVGTARRPPAVPVADPDSALGRALGSIPREDPEGALLTAGAVVGLYRLAGRRLRVDTAPLPAASPPETLPLCSPAAAARLDAIVGGRFRPVLGEWLSLAAAAGAIVPPDRLPALLDVTTAGAGLRPSALPVIGERGRWLAARNPAWAWAAGGGGSPEEEAVTWATGSAAARRLLLGRLRATDPAAARDRLTSTWTTETPDDRASFVAALASGLSPDDEPFLEAALDDRRKEVRQAAADLLVRLPDSRLAARMAARARPLVRVTGSVRKRFEVILPTEVDPAMVRDGIVATPPAGVGERAWWLSQIVAAAPLRTWTEALGPPPARLVELAGAGDAGPLVRRAWATAAARQADEAWALALLDAEVVREPGLLQVVPHDRAVAVSTRLVADLGLAPAVVDVLQRCPVPWGPALGRTVVDRLGTAVQGRPQAELRARLADLAARLDPALAPLAATVLGEHAAWWADVVGWFVDLLTFRAAMREEL